MSTNFLLKVKPNKVGRRKNPTSRKGRILQLSPRTRSNQHNSEGSRIVLRKQSLRAKKIPKNYLSVDALEITKLSINVEISKLTKKFLSAKGEEKGEIKLEIMNLQKRYKDIHLS